MIRYFDMKPSLTVERVDVAEIRQAAASMAWFACNAAMTDAKIPRPEEK